MMQSPTGFNRERKLPRYRHSVIMPPLCDSAANLTLVKHYYGQSLTYRPENPVALYGLAEVALKQGDTDLAKQYAKRSYDAALQGDDAIAKHGLLDLIAKRWPDIVPR